MSTPRLRHICSCSAKEAAGLFCVIVFLALAESLCAQDTPREARQKAQMALSQGNFAEAVIHLEQLVQWFGDSTRDTTIAQMESVYYSLGTAYFFMGDFPKAREVFETYLKKYRTGIHAPDVSVYIADSLRFEASFEPALRAYQTALKKYELGPDTKADIYASMARCYLAQDKWDKAIPVLQKLYVTALDFDRRNWAATLLTTAYLKERDLEKVYRLVPYLLLPGSFASRSAALNLAALEVGDALFADEQYRAALWIYRLVYPHDTLLVRCQQHLDRLQRRAERLKKVPDNPRPLMRVQESIGEVEAELKALATVENYDIELQFRIARAYLEIRRYRESCELFVSLYQEAEGKRAEEALFYAFFCAARIQPWDRAFELGEEYARVYPGGEYYDQVTLMLGQMRAKLEQWPEVIGTLTKALEVSPKHQEAAECMFLIGYASFMEEKFADTVAWMTRMNKTYPGNPREADGVYWTGMALMFDRKFEEAGKEFDAILMDFPQSVYAQDAAFRRAVCDFGLSRYREAEKRLTAFVAQFPDSKLSGEAYMMLGDIAGVFGELPKAVTLYRKVLSSDVHIEFYNHAAFRCGEILMELNEFPALVRHFNDYIQRNREGSNIPLAMYWVGVGMWNSNEKKGALEFFRQGVEKYGADRGELGIDMILEEWVGRGRGVDSNMAAQAWGDLRDLLRKAEQEKQQTLVLRLKRIFLYEPGIADEQREALLADIMKESNLPHASAGVLELIIEQAQRRKNTELAVRAAEETIRAFPETDYALSARMVLARRALELKDYSAAIRHLTVIKEVYAASGEAAEALMLLGDLYIRQGKYPEADECYKSVLSVREWRGPLWPAALYGRGECARLQHNYEQASAYYERIYVMYGSYREWTAKAYLARADCLARLKQYNKAAETLREMLSLSDLQDAPETAEARRRLEQMDTRTL